jgi:hypothetical protein
MSAWRWESMLTFEHTTQDFQQTFRSPPLRSNRNLKVAERQTKEMELTMISSKTVIPTKLRNPQICGLTADLDDKIKIKSPNISSTLTQI